MRSSSLFSPMAAVRRPSPHRSLAAVLLSLRALTGKPGSSGREEGCREGERRKAMGGSTVAARRDMRSLSPSSFPLVMPSSLLVAIRGPSPHRRRPLSFSLFVYWLDYIWTCVRQKRNAEKARPKSMLLLYHTKKRQILPTKLFQPKQSKPSM